MRTGSGGNGPRSSKKQPTTSEQIRDSLTSTIGIIAMSCVPVVAIVALLLMYSGTYSGSSEPKKTVLFTVANALSARDDSDGGVNDEENEGKTNKVGCIVHRPSSITE